MEFVLDLGELSVDVICKDIKNLHLSVHPPTGRVRIAAPERASLDTIRAFAVAHLAWIRRNQRKILMQEREPAREYLDRESHFVWGERLMLRVIERDAAPAVSREHHSLTLQVRPGTSKLDRQQIVDAWYRDEVRKAAFPILSKWEALLDVSINQVFVQKMKTKWGSCNPNTKNIRLNTDLAKKPHECLSYIVLHELTHLIARTHSPEFFEYLDRLMPQWRHIRQMLNDLPLSFTPGGADPSLQRTE